MPDRSYDIVIVGASLGGVAAALAAARAGASVGLLEASDWAGGQYSAQGVCRPDDNTYADTTGSTASYREFRARVRDHYRQTYTLSGAAKQRPPETFDPGSIRPGFAVEPRVAHDTFVALLRAAKVDLSFGVTVVDAQCDRDTIAAVTGERADGTRTRYTAKVFLDATDLGDLLPLANAEFRLGAEGQAELGEANAPPQARRDWIQPFSIVFALEHRPYGEKHTIPKPLDYDDLKREQDYRISDGQISTLFGSAENMWNYRQYIDSQNFVGAFPNDLTTINTGSTDYESDSLPAADGKLAARIVARARRAALGYLFWLQTEYVREDGRGTGYPELMLRTDVFGTPDGTAPQPYIRESRRIQAMTTVAQQDIDAADNPGPRAHFYRDSCGIGAYPADVHAFPKTGMPWSGTETKPFQIPVRALIPVRVQNLLAACKNIGVSHLTNGAYRVHPVEWNVGESAGALAAFVIRTKHTLHGVATDDATLRAYQRTLVDAGIPLYWWSDVAYETDPKVFAAVHLLAVRGILVDGPSPADAGDLSFAPTTPLTAAERRRIDDWVHTATRGKLTIPWPAGSIERGAAAVLVAQQLKL